MVTTFEHLIKNEIRFLDERYIKDMSRIIQVYMDNGKTPPKKLMRKIYAIKGINDGSIRFHPYAVNSIKLMDDGS